MSAPSFFAQPPQPRHAFLSAYKAEELRGRFGVRIELAPLWFTDSIGTIQSQLQRIDG
jgi:hypothetical protein